MDLAPLFEPLQVKNKTLRNRIVFPPVVANRDLKTKAAWDWYGERAAGGASLVIVESTDIIRFDGELTAANLRPLVQAIHNGGALAGIQLFPGRRGQKTTPADLTAEDIRQMLASYTAVTKVCAAAGFDAVEPHGAHGYLLNQFFSAANNQRTDQYGGSLQNRMRLGLDIVAAMAPAAHEAGMLLLYRHTPVRGGYGYSIEESVAFGRALVSAGVDVLDISPASDVSPGDRAVPFMPLGVPVIAVNKLDQVERALTVLNDRRAHLVAIGRGLIADPFWPIKVREGRFNDIIECTGCDQCHADLRQGIEVGCAEWYGRK